ncbi:MAG: hypothetical protein IPM54_21635 [Polyangiaceae bacterium]|nr:hypothetical protein [Polyangiaceae bacterium]
MKRLCFALGMLGCLSWAPCAHANGRFPSAGHVEVDPADPAHIVLRATYGLLVTHDGGSRWDWICESAMGFSGIWDPPIGITAGGAILVGLADGLSISTPDACQFSRVASLEGKFVADLAVGKKNPARAVVLTSIPLGATFDTRLFLTEDGGSSFIQIGNVFSENLRGLTVDLAPSDPSIVYVSGVVGGPMPRGVVLRSLDSGNSYDTWDVPFSDDEHAPFIGAVDPQNVDRLYVRLDGIPGRLFVTENGGATWQEIFSGEGALLGLALSPDGKTLVLGGEKDGVWRTPVPNWAFEQTSLLHARCLRWADAGIYACTEQVLDGFSVGLSVTEGATFKPLALLSDVCGPVSCPLPICASEWPALSDLVNATSCVEASSSSSSGGGGAAGAGGSSNGPPSAVGGCSCRAGRSGDDGMAFLSLATLAFWRMRRRRVS